MKQDIKHIIWRLKQQPKQGNIGDAAKNAADALSTQLTNALTQAGNAGLTFTNTFGGVIDALTSMNTENTAAVAGINKLQATLQGLNKGFLDNVDSITKIYQRNNELMKSFGMTEKAAQSYGYDLDELSVKLGYGREETEKYINSLSGISAGYGLLASKGGVAGTKLIKLQRYMTDMVGVSEEAAEGMQMFMAGAGVDGEKYLLNLRAESIAIEELTGLKGVQRDIEEEIGKLSSEAQLQFSRMPGKIGLSVMRLKQMGLGLEQLTKTGDSLLNIEQSTSDELEYQLLSGQRLVKNGKSLTNEYRKAYLAGDTEKMASSLADAYETQKDVLKTNMLARKQYEKAFGLEEGAVAKMIQKEELINKLRTDDATKKELLGLTGEDLKKKIDELRSNGSLKIDATEIANVMAIDDTRSEQTKMAESLRRIETEGILIHFKDKSAFTNQYDAVMKDLTTSLTKYTDAIKGTAARGGEGISQGMAASTGLFSFNQVMNDSIGGLSIVNKSFSSVNTELTTLSAAVPLLSNRITQATTNISEWSQSLTGTAGNLDNMQINQVGQLNLGQQGGQQNDAVMVNDGFVKFNPRDKFTKVNDGMTVAGTNVGGIDRFAAQMEKRDSKFEQTMTRLISSMAAQMKQAVESANLKVELDRTFSSTTLNKGRYA